MAKASFIKKRREAEIQAKSLKVEQELAKAQARVRALDKENKVDKSKAVVLSGIEREKDVAEEELHKNMSPGNSKKHHGIQTWNTFQEIFHCKKATFKRNYLAWSTSDARNFSLVNETWSLDPTVS